MKKRIAWVALFALSASTLLACSHPNDNPPSSESDSAEAVKGSVSFKTHEDAIEEYGTLQLSATVEGGVGALAWTTDDPSLLSVDQNGLVTSLGGTGDAKVTAYIGDGIGGSYSDTITLHVTSSTVSPSLVLGSSALTMNPSGVYSLSPKLYWGEKDLTSLAELSFSYSSESDKKIVSVSQSGNAFAIKALSSGEAKLYFESTFRGRYVSASLPIYVNSDLIVFEPKDSSAYSPALTGYKTELSRVALQGFATERSLDFDVYVNGKKDANASLQWTISSGEDYVSLASGKVSAKTIGSASLVGKYVSGTHEGTLSLDVEVVRPHVELTEGISLEVENLPKSVALPEAEQVLGDSGDVKLNGRKVGSYSKGSIAFTKSRLPKAAKNLGDVTMTLQTDSVEYTFPAHIVSMIIDNKEEFDSFLKVAKENNSDSRLADGYFLLNADIDYDGTMESMFNSRDLYGAAQSGWSNGAVCGFQGVFDGQGHNISGVRIENIGSNQDSGGIFGVMHTGGVVKNLSFTNAEVTCCTGFLCSAGDGLFQDIYVQYSRVGEKKGNWRSYTANSSARRYCGTFYTYNQNSSIGSHAKLDRCVVDARGAKLEDYAFYETLDGSVDGEVKQGGALIPSICLMNNYLATGLSSRSLTLCEDPQVLSHSGSLYEADKLSSLGDGASSFLASFSSSLWHNDGTNLAMNNAIAKYQGQPLTMTTSGTNILHPGETASLSINYPCSYLDFTFSKANCSVSAGTLSIGSSYDPTVLGSDLTVTATSRLDANQTASLPFLVRNKAVFPGVQKVYLNESLDENGALVYGNSNISLDLSAYSTSESVSGLRIDGELKSEGVTYSNGTLSFPASLLGTHYGRTTFFVAFQTTDLELTLDLVSQVITTKDQLNSFEKLACALEPDSPYDYGGYFELGANIAYDDTWSVEDNGMGFFQINEKAIFTVENGYGFQGVFDGCGYAISGMTTSSDADNTHRGGFITCLAETGVLENIAFTNLKHQGCGTIVTVGSGTVKNLFAQRTQLSLTEQRAVLLFGENESWGEKYKGSPTMENLIIDDTAFNGVNLTSPTKYATTGINTCNGAKLTNVYLATSNQTDIGIFTWGNGSGMTAGLNNTGRLDNKKLSAICDDVATVFTKTSASFNSSWDAIWQTGSGVPLSNGTTK